MKRYIWPVLFFIISISTLSCTAATSALVIEAVNTDRNAEFNYYSCTLLHDGTYSEIGSRDGRYELFDLEGGVYEIFISAVDEKSGEEYRAETKISLDYGLRELRLVLEKVEEHSKSMKLHFEGIGSFTATLIDYHTGIKIFSERGYKDGVMDLPKLSYGKYMVKIMNSRMEEFIYSFACSKGSPEELVFLEDRETEESIEIDLFNLATSPIEGNIRIKEGKDSLMLELKILKIDRNIDEKDLVFQWYANGEYIESGRKLEIEKTNGVVRFDVVIKSRYIGSYGSESISISISK